MFAVNSLFRGGFYSIFVCSNNEINNRQVIKHSNMRRNAIAVSIVNRDERTRFQ